MSAIDYVPLPPPQPKADAGPPKLTTEQEGLYKKLYEHFTKDGYTLPGEEKGEFTEEEKFWLVCFSCGGVFMRESADGLRCLELRVPVEVRFPTTWHEVLPMRPTCHFITKISPSDEMGRSKSH